MTGVVRGHDVRFQNEQNDLDLVPDAIQSGILCPLLVCHGFVHVKRHN